MLKPYNKAEISFNLQTEIGQEGSNSNTYIAHDQQLDAQIVIKKVPKTSLESVDSFFDESRTLYLTSHPNVVPVHYACQDSDHVFIAMPYYQKGSLNKLIEERFLTVREVVILGCQIASGLHNIHSKRLVHFDIKPDNILISNRGEALIADFGLSKKLSLNGLAGQDRLYFKMCPPETYTKSEFSPTFDIYQLGLTLYRMCNGNREFYDQFKSFGDSVATFDRDGFKFAVRNGRFPDRSIYPEHIPERLKKLISKCLEPDPAARYQAAIEVANALALVDEKLDWEFHITEGARTWLQRKNDRAHTLTVSSSGSAVGEKRVGNGKSQRILGACKSGMTTAEIKKFLKDHDASKD